MMKVVICRFLLRVLPYSAVGWIAFYGHRLLHWVKYGDATFPRAFSIEINTHCNRRCYYCPQSVEPTKVGHIKDEVFHQILFRLRELNWKGQVDFNFYNEPLLEPRLEEYIRLLKLRCPQSVPHIMTNGDFLTEDKAKSLFNAGVFKIRVTQHPPYKKEWDERIMALVKKFPTRIFHFNIENAKLSTRGGMVNPKKTSVEHIRRHGCNAPECSLLMSIDGDYIFCCDYRKVNIIGNVFSMPIREAWKAEPWKSYREKVKNAIPLLDVCKGCFGQL